MSELVINPRSMQKVQAEIRCNLGAKTKVDADDHVNFTYLKIIVKETLRLHPPAPLLIPRQSSHMCQIRGEKGKVYDIYPQNKSVDHINAWTIGRDPKYWKNPNEFYPNRFDRNDVDFRGQHFEFLPFGGGRRICPCINNSIATIELTLANLLYWFDWEVPNGMKMEDIASLERRGRRYCPQRTHLTLVPIEHTWQ